MPTPAQVNLVLSCARGDLGTPFVHQGRVPGPRGGLDCVGEIVCTCQRVGYPIQDFRAYGRDSDSKEILRRLRLHFDELQPGQQQPGDVLVMWVVHRLFPQHVAWFTGSTVIHAYSRNTGGRVLEEPFDRWARHVYGVFRLREWSVAA